METQILIFDNPDEFLRVMEELQQAYNDNEE